jgi:hypothetical protein
MAARGLEHFQGKAAPVFLRKCHSGKNAGAFLFPAHEKPL